MALHGMVSSMPYAIVLRTGSCYVGSASILFFGADRIFNEIDVNHDNELSLEEVTTALKKVPAVAKPSLRPPLPPPPPRRARLNAI